MAGTQREIDGAARGIGEPDEVRGAYDRQEAWLMSFTEELPLELWIDPGSDPITGWLSYPGGERQPFGGWVELTAAIESARRELAGVIPGAAEHG